MLKADEFERREFIRIKIKLPVAYKFFSTTGEFEIDEIFEGYTENISGDGMLLVGKLPSLDITPSLLLGRVVVGVNIFLDDNPAPVKALTRVKWLESIDQKERETKMGLQFKEITKDSKDRILRFIIKTQLP